MSLSPLPTHTEVTTFLQRLLPTSSNAREVPFLWHTPKHAAYQPSIQSTPMVVLSITPTPGFYAALKSHRGSTAPVCFLHRPWSLVRRDVRHGSLVLSSHASFDEHLTVGWNTELAERIGMNLASAVCIRGYKNNPDRKIGLVARLVVPRSRCSLATELQQEFDGTGELFHPETTETHHTSGPDIRTVAIMNAFHSEEVRRVLEAAHSQDWISADEDGSSILFLTGAVREYGLASVKEVNMPAFCIGHRACEEWGIRFLASQLRGKWPHLEVVVVLEEEPVVTKASDSTEA